MESNKIITVEISNIDEFIEKLEKLKKLLQEINNVELNVEVK